MSDRVVLTPYFLDEPLPGLETLMQPGWRVNKSDLPVGTKQERMSILHKPIATNVEQALRDGDLPVSIGGDCCTAIAVTAGLQRAGIDHLLIWFDAHGDFNTRETSPSGFLGGMPLAMLVGRGEQSMLEALEMEPHTEEKVLFTDGRDLDPLERKAMEGSRLVHIRDVNDVQTYDLPDMPLYIHFDTDILDPVIAPAMNYFAEGGPDLTLLKSVFRHLAGTGRIAAVSLSSWNPALDTDGSTQRVCMEALGVLVGG